jgi:hypothetical protein
MAQYILIDGYLDSLRTSVRWRRDHDDIVAEVEDHLYSAVEQSEARGIDSMLAQQHTLERFGDPDVLATAFASTPQGGLAVPTQFTKTAGTVALVSAAAWFFALAGFWLASSFPDRAAGTDPDQFILDGQTGSFLVATMALLAGGALMVVTMVGLYRRHGGLGALGMVGLAVTGLGVATSFFWWAFVVWLTLMGIGTLIFAFAMLRRDIAPRFSTAAWGAGMTVGAVVWSVLRWLEVGPTDEWGDYWIANVSGMTAGILIMSVGLAGLGLWLRSEQPVALEPAKPLATT